MKRFAWIFLLFITFAGFAFAPKAHALQPTNDLQKFITIVDDKSKNDTMSWEWYVTNQVGGFQTAPILYMIGGSNDPASQFNYKKSALAYMDSVITGVYQTPPADLALWIQDTGQSLGFLPKKVYAQGIGFSGLSPILEIWKAFRNIAYAVLAVIMIVIGFMVMFRQKIDPKTVVTVQNALPRIVITLLLITFSYAIVGLMVDLMYVVLTLIISVLISASKGALGADTATKYLSGNFFTMLGAVFNGSLRSIDDIIAFFGAAPALGTIGASSGIGGLLGFLVAGAATAVPAAAAAPIIGFAIPILAILIVAIILLFAVIRLLFLLIGAYIQIIVALLSAPFQLLAGAIPGNNAFGSWILGLVSNLLVFPITAGLLLVANILASMEKNPIGIPGAGAQGPALWVPPLIGNTGRGVSGVIALGILLTIPSIVNGIKEAFKAKPIIPLGGVGQALGSPMGTATQLLSLGYYIKGFTTGDVRGKLGVKDTTTGEGKKV